ncbi:cupin domain-containing protein [Lysobacter solisilvae (ex Woo and Kim 2020)]|uniref:Cupin domain-containing protein n=1 Tax=Agrilutibacter terrestris TaxID=2865112 RepID=A0A7H0FUG3_9GAMM|nr:cupin domain-containing protein [Lysobacter terrestris]QNP39679.1 cupin domain-containing protein [Lysobacter terrestris]
MKASILFCLCLLPGPLWAAEPQADPANAPMTHAMVRAASIQWGAAPPALPPGAQAVVLSGDPGKPGAFAIRLKAPPGYRVPRHWHPTDEQVTVLEGDFTLSMGDAADAHAADLVPGDYVLLPKQMLHEASTRNGGVVQINSTGPFEINYINPADDPRKQAAPKAAGSKR